MPCCTTSASKNCAPARRWRVWGGSVAASKSPAPWPLSLASSCLTALRRRGPHRCHRNPAHHQLPQGARHRCPSSPITTCAKPWAFAIAPTSSAKVECWPKAVRADIINNAEVRKGLPRRALPHVSTAGSHESLFAVSAVPAPGAYAAVAAIHSAAATLHLELNQEIEQMLEQNPFLEHDEADSPRSKPPPALNSSASATKSKAANPEGPGSDAPEADSGGGLESIESGATERDDWENGTERDDFDGIRETPAARLMTTSTV